MAENDQKRPGSAAPTPEAHGNRDARGTAGAENAARAAQSTEQEAAQKAQHPPQAAATTAPDPASLNRVKAAIEAILLAASEPMNRRALEKCLEEDEYPLINGALENLKLEYSGPHRGIHLLEVAGGFQLRTNVDYRHAVRRMFEATPRKLSRAALETLAIIAYRQPLTRADVEEVRGVDSSGVMRTLEEHDLVHTIGRLDDLGRPHIWGTTTRFLEFFGLDTLADLPTLSESELEALDEMYADELADAAESTDAEETHSSE